MNNKISTSIEQSKRLVKHELDVNTADMYWRSLNLNGHISWSNHIKRLEPPIYDDEHYVPAWSLQALLDMIPESIDEYTDNFSQLELTKKSISYVYANGMLRIGFLHGNLIDAATEMVIWLLENKKIS